MISNETKTFNKKYVRFQKDFNKGWKIGFITVISVAILLILAIYLLINLM